MIIGLIGTRCAGKTEVAKILSEKGFNILSFGDEEDMEQKLKEIKTKISKTG